MKHLLSILNFFFCFALYSQGKEVIITQGKSQNEFKLAINNPDVGTISIKSDIVIYDNLTIPNTKVLKFYNGNKLIITSGSLTLKECHIDAGKYQIFKGKNIKGSFSNDIVYPEWFGAKANDKIDDAYAMQKAIDMTLNEVFLSRGEYVVNKELKKEWFSNKPNSVIGVNIKGAGQKATFIKVTHTGNFITYKGGESSSKRIQGNTVKDLSIIGNKNAKNGLSFYSCRYTDISNVNISNFTNAAIVFEGNPSLNPDATATIFTNIENCELTDNKIGILNKLSNNSPLLTMESTLITHNSQAGVIWNSSYFKSVNSSISYNGSSSNSESLGGFYNDVLDYYPAFEPSEYISKGIVIESTEFDSNYPSSITIKESRGAKISNCSIILVDRYAHIDRYTDKGVICIGGKAEEIDGKEYGYRARNTLIQNNSIQYIQDSNTTFVENNACLIRLSEGAIYTIIDNNCFYTNKKNSLGKTHFYIKEYKKTGITRANFGFKESYLKLSNTQCINPKNLLKTVDLVYPKLTKRRLRR